MERRQHGGRFQAFFKVYLPTSAERIGLPEAYVSCMEGVISPTAILRHPDGKCWTVKLERLGNRLFFTHGWDKYVRANSLETGDFLFFQYIGHGLYNVKLLGKHGSEKEQVEIADENHAGEVIKFVKQMKNKPDPYGSKMFESGFFRKPKNPYFVTSLRRERRNELFVPNAFIEDHNIRLPPKIILKDKKGRTWNAKLKHWKDGRIWYYGGWSRLCRVNNVTGNDICVCEFKTRDEGFVFFRVHIVRERRIIQAMTN